MGKKLIIFKFMEFDFSDKIQAAKKGKAPLNKPFRLPSGSKKKFGVYVKNDKGNIVMVKFGDPNMTIKRDNPARRKAYRARHGCDTGKLGPKWKANYWSCKMWEAKKSVTDYTKGQEIILEAEVQGKNKGLWYNIQQKKKRMGKNYTPAKPGSPDRPTPEAIKKAQANDYMNEDYLWDGETEFDQQELMTPELNNVEQIESPEEELQEYKDDFYGMIVGSITAIQANAQNILNKLNDPMVRENLTEPFLQQMAALAEDYMITIHNYVMFNKEDESIASAMFKVGDKIRNINAMCKHYGSEGIVKEIRELPQDMGYAVIYECTNDGPTWKKGDMLGKTEIQLQKISEAKWSKEYKDRIDCKNPKGFSQKAHCQSLKKK
ncbi:MAG: hypothetical protein EBR82_66045 [Caulobacteraceae bacterium]|nr:hypothetical protein [Caulobacteraceae bacterium]